MPKTLLLATDHKHSILAELSEEAFNTLAYSSHGHLNAQHSMAANLAFNGEFRERPFGWYLLGKGYRAYNPVLMCFHSPDSWSPFGRGGLNGYRYCGGDPVNASDPSGHVRLPVRRSEIRKTSPQFQKLRELRKLLAEVQLMRIQTASGLQAIQAGLKNKQPPQELRPQRALKIRPEIVKELKSDLIRDLALNAAFDRLRPSLNRSAAATRASSPVTPTSAMANSLPSQNAAQRQSVANTAAASAGQHQITTTGQAAQLAGEPASTLPPRMAVERIRKGVERMDLQR